MLRDAVDDLYDGLRLALWRPESAAELSAAVRCNVEFLHTYRAPFLVGDTTGKKVAAAPIKYELLDMKYNRTNNVIQLYPSAPAVREGLDFAAVNRRATLRFRAAERRRNVMNAIESAVTALIGVGFAVCVALTLTML